MSASGRRTHLLEGIVRTCSTAGVEFHRILADEVTVSNMENLKWRQGVSALAEGCHPRRFHIDPNNTEVSI
ncbi:hypothetical protein PLICRDRAFT_35484 [Plicaturopsis crispa FD-325 SS-3]|nr:hypothetical protein PLICRDRAFT_35484 [Plicaturopsis crispa FD-325 SS-3]